MSLSAQSCPLLGRERIAPLSDFESLPESGIFGVIVSMHSLGNGPWKAYSQPVPWWIGAIRGAWSHTQRPSQTGWPLWKRGCRNLPWA